MHRGHPLLCGTLLGLTWTLLSLLFQGVDWLAAWSLEREGATLLGMDGDRRADCRCAEAAAESGQLLGA